MLPLRSVLEVILVAGRGERPLSREVVVVTMEKEFWFEKVLSLGDGG